jgi:hypothetical protein
VCPEGRSNPALDTKEGLQRRKYSTLDQPHTPPNSQTRNALPWILLFHDPAKVQDS